MSELCYVQLVYLIAEVEDIYIYGAEQCSHYNARIFSQKRSEKHMDHK